jgi:hypothetical protein
MSLNRLRDKVGAINAKNGFHKKEFNLGEKLMLITSELAECLEADRVGRHSDEFEYTKRFLELAELVDALIRIFDTAYLMNINLDGLFDLITYNNSLRDYKHGKNY